MRIPADRIATGTHLDLLQSSMRRLEKELARRELEISTGLRVRSPSDDPLAAVRYLSHRASRERAEGYLKRKSLTGTAGINWGCCSRPLARAASATLPER